MKLNPVISALFEAIASHVNGIVYLASLSSEQVLRFRVNFESLTPLINELLSSDSYFQMLKVFSGIERERFDWIMGEIKTYYCRYRHVVPRPTLQFFTELPFLAQNMEKTISLYKFVPVEIFEDGERELFIVGSMQLATGDFENKLLCCNNDDSLLKIKDFGQKEWVSLHRPKFSQVEKSVFILSAMGFSSREIADDLNKSIDTIKSIRVRLFDKLETNDVVRMIHKLHAMRF